MLTNLHTRMKYILLITTFLLSILNPAYCQQQKPSFRILAPQVICKNKKDAAVETPSQITISMQTEGGQKLTYRVQMYFEVLGGYRGQQHSLSLWRAVRMMEKKINVNDKSLISDKNQINVNNTELVQGVFYSFTIIGIDKNGVESESQNFTVAYSDGKIKRTNADGSIIPDDITFLMLGREVAYANLEYKIEANVKFCSPRNDYYIKWDLSNLPESYKNIIQIPGNTLRVPSGVFEGGKTYTITAKLIQLNDSRELLSDKIDVNVKKRGFGVQLIPENIVIGISRPLNLKLLFTDYDNSGLTPNISWACKEFTNNRECDTMEEVSQYQQSIEIYEKGLYAANAIVLLDTSVTVVSKILIDPDVIVVPQFKNPPLKAIQAGERFEMDTTLDGLIPNCVAYWSVVNDTDYQFFDIDLIPGGLGNISIMDIEGNFLSELVDFVNTTMSRDILLVVPRKGEYSNWDGLKPNAKYKFRLIMTCPAPISNVKNQTQSQNRRNVTSYADITITTNQPPIGKVLEVTPQSGVGLKTIFKFSTGVALDDNTDYPLKYNFQIVFDGLKVSIGEFYENMVTTSLFPYSESNISTIYEVCDSREACSIVNGPIITTTMPSDADINLNDIINSIKASMSRMEYHQSFSEALIAGITLKNHTLFSDFKSSFTKIVQNEINRLLENPTVPYVSSSEIVKFVNYTKTSDLIINGDDTMDQGLLELLEASENCIQKSEDCDQSQSELMIKSLRRKRSILKTFNQRNIGDTEKSTLDVLANKIGSTNESISVDGKKRLVEKVETFVTKLCKDSSSTYHIINESIITMDIRKPNVNQIIRTNLTIPNKQYERPAFVQINANLNVNPKNDFCVGKVMFPSDYLSGQRNTDEIYELFIVEKNINGKINTVDISDGSGEGNILLSIPIKKEFGNYECQVWKNDSWSSNICNTSLVRNGYVYCRCQKISIFRAVEKVTNTTMMESTITSIVSSTSTTAATTTISTNQTDPAKNVVETLTNTQAANTNEFNTTIMELSTITADTLTTSLKETVMNQTTTTPMSVTYSDMLPKNLTSIVGNTNTPINILNTSASDILEFVTLPSNDTSTQLTTLATTSTSPIPVNITEATKLIQNDTLSTATNNNYTESVLSTIISSIDSNSTVLHKDTLTANDEKRAYSSTTGYVLAVVFIIAGIFIVVGLFVYSRRKKPNSLAQQLEIISSEIRTSNNAVKYARFHDEETMRGDNIETIFTAQ